VNSEWREYQIALFPKEKLSYCHFHGRTVHNSLLVIHYKKQNAFSLPSNPGVFCAQRRDGGQKIDSLNSKK
jgi:hypothetical protein